MKTTAGPVDLSDSDPSFLGAKGRDLPVLAQMLEKASSKIKNKRQLDFIRALLSQDKMVKRSY